MTKKAEIKSMAAFYREYEAANPNLNLVSYRKFTGDVAKNPEANLEDLILAEVKEKDDLDVSEIEVNTEDKDFMDQVEEEEDELKVWDKTVRAPRGA